MYLRRTTRKKGGTEYDCWLLVESVRTALGPRQRVVATIGKLPGLDREERIGWEEISRISLDVLLPTREKILRLRMVATPDKELKVLLQRMKILLPNKPKIIENVVTKMA
jgi:hypothetical protein